MKLQLKDFQEVAVEELGIRGEQARSEASQGVGQAVVFSAPTGSGKTVMATAWMEALIRGDENRQGDPEATFLWVTDQPELNEQTRRKFLDGSDLFDDAALITVDADSFDQPRFDPGVVYFLNTQKLSRTSNLTKPGDGRTYTIWETIATTAAERPASFWVVIDEAHRGMKENGNGVGREARTIIQKFVKGSDEIPPVPLIAGISATAKRFSDLLSGTPRTQRSVTVEPEDVRASGLLKDTIVLYHPEEDQPSDLTLLAAAARRQKQFAKEWRNYAEENKQATVHPVLVVQVEDGRAKELTKTDLAAALETIEKVLGPLGSQDVCHAFQEQGTVLVGQHSRALDYVAPSDIEAKAELQVVFFKRALSTGWDCPRAEVMMSFRTARDETLIAQLVGRMVRAPLAERVSGSDLLNSVALYLPYYDEKALDSVIKRLSEPDPDQGLPGIDVKSGKNVVEFTVAPGLEAAFDAAQGLPVYRVERTAKLGQVRRLMKLGLQLGIHELDQGAYKDFLDAMVVALEAERSARAADTDFQHRVDEAAKIDVRAVTVAVGSALIENTTTSKLTAEERNIENAYQEAVRKLGDGEAGAGYLRLRAAEEQTHQLSRFKQELYALMGDADVRAAVDAVAEQLADAALTKHDVAINHLPDQQRQKYRGIRRQGGVAKPEPWDLYRSIQGTNAGTTYPKHLFVADDGKFSYVSNNLEDKVLTEELAGGDEVLAWLRNEPRKPWAFSINYSRHGVENAMYPDFIIFRKANGRILCDVLEPHSQREADSAAKARGLAIFADKHGHQFGRIELIDEVDGTIKRLRLKETETNKRVKSVANDEHLRQLFNDA